MNTMLLILIYMGSKRRWYIVTMFFFFFFVCSLTAESINMNNISSDSLDDLLRDYSFKALNHSHTGSLYKANLPANFSGIEASIVRLRSGSFWIRGANFSAFHIPPRIRTIPYVKRLAIVYQNLGNWSSQYYNAPAGYLMVTPVVGFLAYNASNATDETGFHKLNLSVMDEPISVRFPQFPLPKGSNSSTLKCIRFNGGGLLMELSEIKLATNMCLTRDQGHFSVVIEEPAKEVIIRKKKARLWAFSVIGFTSVIVGLVVFGLVGFLVYKFVQMKRIERMERQADAGEAFETVWIGSSRMPSAKVIRTQPVIEYSENHP